MSLEIIDLGAGTGANQRWLAPRLPFVQRWIHLDHDPAISRSLPLPDDTMIIDGSVERRSSGSWPIAASDRLVTCSALLDVLTTAEIDAVCSAVIDNHVPALFSLTVTGALSIGPAGPVRRAARSMRSMIISGAPAGPVRMPPLGPSMPCAQADLRYAPEETPWRLTASSDWAFVEQLLQERLDAAVAQNPSLASAATGWFELRRSQFVLGILRIEVGHRDVLALPGGLDREPPRSRRPCRCRRPR